MSGLFQSLSTAAASLTAHRIGLDVTGQNIANVNTPGYSRRMVLLAERPPTEALSAGRGVEVLGIQALRDMLVEGRLRREQQGVSADQAMVDTLSTIDSAIGLPGASLDARLTAFFDAFADLTTSVQSPVLRDRIVQQGDELARAFHDTAATLALARSDADQSIRVAVAEVNDLAATVASLNARIVDGGPDVESLRDQQNVALGKLAGLIDISVLQNPEGTVGVTVGAGAALVIGTTAYDVDVTPTGAAALQLNGVDITPAISSGRIGGLLHARDALVPAYQARLDQLAFDLTAAVNAVHTAGFDATGAPAGDFFAPLTVVAGAAALFGVDPAVAADSGTIAASSTGATGDNQTARAIAALRDAPLAPGRGSAFDEWGALTQTIGADLVVIRDDGATREGVLRQVQRLRDQASGVSMDEEAANLMKFQRAYEANARYFTTIVDTLDALMAMVG
jgi:flagellar hook-associated protein 1 FlgK